MILSCIMDDSIVRHWIQGVEIRPREFRGYGKLVMFDLLVNTYYGVWVTGRRNAYREMFALVEWRTP